MSIIDLIKDQLSGDLLGKLSGAVGESEETTRAAAGAAVPSLLSVLANSVLSGKGADGLLQALRDYEGRDVASMLRAPSTGGTPPPPPGGDVLGSLLGPNLSTLINILSKFSGVGLAGMKTLLSYLGPIILSTIAAQLKGKGGLNAANLTSFFTTEKENITRALPAGLSLADLPSTSGVPTSLPKAPEAGAPSWILPAVAIALIALAGLYYLTQPSAEAPDGVTPIPPVSEVDPLPSPTIPEAPEIKVEVPSADEVTKSLTEVYTGAAQTLASVTDVETAEAAAPKLEGYQSTLDGLTTVWEKIPAEAKSTVVKATVEHLDELKSLVGKVLEIPGVGEKLKPILDALVAKLTGFTA